MNYVHVHVLGFTNVHVHVYAAETINKCLFIGAFCLHNIK